MWFKNLRVYSLTEEFKLSAEELHEKMEPLSFVPCGQLDPVRNGWVSPLGAESQVLAHAANGFIVFTMKAEQKVLPTASVNDELNKRIAQLSKEESRHVGRKERQAIKDEVIFSLLPKALTKSSLCHAYIDAKEHLLVVNTSSSNTAEQVISMLRESIGSLKCLPLVPQNSIRETLTRWVSDESGGVFGIGEECELTSSRDERVIRCKHQDLGAEEVQNHIGSGLQVSKLALSWNEGISFVLDESFTLKRLKFSDNVQEKSQASDAESAAEAFDQEFSVMTLELRAMLNDLLFGFGGIASV